VSGVVLKATSIVRANFLTEMPWDILVLDSTERHLRRKLITLQHGDEVMVDLDKTTKLEDRDCLVLENGRLVQIIAAEEDLLEITGRNAEHLIQLAWHIGNRHLEAQIEATRILIRRDHVIAHMLVHQGAKVHEVREAFSPENGAYHSHEHGPHTHDH
jgi:urease accessory protein